ncbi:hypothetical protein KP003_08375 [Geomonas nitrogeniifigens]|uniref:MBOAT family protein n=1 Tax=Geomonas diazotrophica TaxID=2843197 RepID=A0ABX8JMM0_9BACT|nr:MBOAT family O-acyltransferase [Geomonas nitrogeniifigens]QWV99231.1 hypothetical protein KP005_08115 [Geomonas nitrogeniifigens]QXE88400.1 hypothetical protein KP003_08375 [Geomonas nitrogeniifigens]
MPLYSTQYLLFLPLVYLFFRCCRHQERWSLLLVASFVFYASLGALYLPLLLAFAAAANYAFGIGVGKAATPGARTALFWTAVSFNVLILALFKYLPPLLEAAALLPATFANLFPAPPPPLVLVGVSYYLFQCISYLADVYLELQEPERHLGYFALYLAFFPKLMQGPIERGADLLPQLKRPYRFDYHLARSGLLLLTWGLFKKLVLADRLGVYVDTVYGNVHAFSGLPLLLATYGYAFQIYFDFSGYTDMALGSARLFNIDLTQNFNRPYLATSVAEFWRRWHISFSSFILDYLFKPLQMRWRYWRQWGTAAAVMVAFLVSGLWHGARSGFLIWGGLHGTYLACSHLCAPYRKRLRQALGVRSGYLLQAGQVVATFHLVCFAWIFFRAATARDAFYLIGNILGNERGLARLLGAGGESSTLMLAFAVALGVLGHGVCTGTRRFPGWFRYPAYAAVLLACFRLTVSQEAGFIYFGF